jgi:HEAT repeat protein
MRVDNDFKRNQTMMDAAKQNVDQLVADLGSKNAGQRRDARAALVQIGAGAVPALLSALDAPQQHVRWEAAKSLTEIAEPAAAERLIAALGDKDPDVRWVVGVALIALGRDAVKPLLTTLTKSDLRDSVYQGAHHVLHDLAKRTELTSVLEPVLKALAQPEPEVAVPLAAIEVLRGSDV